MWLACYVMLRDRISRVKHSTCILRSTYSIKLENLPNSRIRIERVNLIELKFNSTITLYKILLIYFNNKTKILTLFNIS